MNFLTRVRRSTATLPVAFAATLVFALSARAAEPSSTPPTVPAATTITPIAAETIAAAPDSLFDYDRDAPLELESSDAEIRDGAVIRDLTFRGHKKIIHAYLIAPVARGASHAGALFVHWLGEPASTNRTQFLQEATALASQGIVSLLVDAQWAAPKWYSSRVPEDDYAHSIEQVIDLRRAMDVLLSQPRIDPDRIAFIGHDFGAMYGIVMGAVDPRAKTYVLMAPAPHFADWFLFAQQPKDLPAYRAQLAPLDPVRFINRLAPAPVFFQFASDDEYVPAAAATRLYAAAAPRKHMATYAAKHDLQNPAVLADRVTWLVRELAQP